MSEKQLKYCVIGAGGTGGCLGAYLSDAGADCTLIARGAHLAAMQEKGMTIETPSSGTERVVPVRASDMEHYDEKPDVILVCVKGYSLDGVYPFIRRAAHRDTVVIPILNIYGTGGRMQEKLPELLVTDGCIYVAAEISRPGTILKKGEILRVVFGVRSPEEERPVLDRIAADLKAAGIDAVHSDDIRRDALQKFSYVSPAAACGLYYGASAGAMQEKGEVRDTFALLIHEIDCLAYAMGIRFQQDIVQTNLEILDHLAPEASTSMQRDIRDGKSSEIDGLIYEVIRMADRYGVSVPTYRKCAGEFRARGL